ncbi:OmpA family protein [Dyella sp. S184]|uniref:OmpA family protein n=1 Tax=Dyella sp. S184 TaxID=1641862 RepID=UPI00131D2F8F|nr:OmpA family protein [Dyella sp. S184]
MQLLTGCRGAVLPAVLAGLMLTAGCGTMHGQAPSAGADDGGSIAFPDPAHASRPEGTFVNLENLRNVAPGMTKDQLYALLGAPHFSEGVFGVRKWNYIFDFRKPEGGDGFFRCQYQVAFDKDHLASGFYWKPEACKSVLERLVPTVVAAPLPLPQQESMHLAPMRLASDALFDFNRAELKAQGREQLDDLLQKIRSASQVEDILVIGYTDRIGSDSYNLALSQRRADAVRNYLVAGGVPTTAIRVDGRGKADPVVQCSNAVRPELIACLAPNRRVELNGVARLQS